MDFKLTLGGFVAGFVIFVVAFSLVYVYFASVDGSIAIHRNSAGEIDLTGTTGTLYEVLIIGAVLLAVNGMLAYELWHRERMLSYLFAGFSVLLSLLSLVFVVSTISIN